MQLDRRTAMAAATAAALAPTARAAQPLHLLILGGTGFIGPHQVRYALARGHKVTIFNRGRQPKAWPGEVEELLGDRNTGDLKSLEGKTWDVVIDNPTTLPFWVRDAAKVLKGRVKHYVFISTISVYAESNRIGADETAATLPYTGADAMAETADTLRASQGRLYGPLKAASEQTARAAFGEDRTTVIRPGLIVGPGDETDRFSYWPVRLANDGNRWGPEAVAPGSGDDPVQFIDCRDLAEWIVRMAEKRAAGTFNASGPTKPMPMKAMLAEVGKAVNSQARLVWAPDAFLAAEKVAAWSDMPVWIPARGGDSAGFHRRSMARAQAQGLTYRPLATTAADTLAWFRRQPPERQAKLRSGLTPEREADLLAKLRKA
ncbi:MAG: NAD-dependent epimerase/dehydratase family protein [Phenylobacterium sp.]|uniref:NAD-dependent epimerase/dehydratase family protein n=1 Tax=Phenylobacterium sp. TaxID=1871053 RepID=UPI001A45D71D|nr:NAD-dependent epimerase/dehydratase family protein [Phenylobacterium sp.]MBL8554711.1 NAD-dependent epimerase/dehydratase family protein [Phenylobacterium sp.]